MFFTFRATASGITCCHCLTYLRFPDITFQPATGLRRAQPCPASLVALLAWRVLEVLRRSLPLAGVVLALGVGPCAPGPREQSTKASPNMLLTLMPLNLKIMHDQLSKREYFQNSAAVPNSHLDGQTKMLQQSLFAVCFVYYQCTHCWLRSWPTLKKKLPQPHAAPTNPSYKGAICPFSVTWAPIRSSSLWQPSSQESNFENQGCRLVKGFGAKNTQNGFPLSTSFHMEKAKGCSNKCEHVQKKKQHKSAWTHEIPRKYAMYAQDLWNDLHIIKYF